MAFTDHCDVFGAVHETGINRVVRHVMRQRPSLFNYGTLLVAQNLQLLCSPVDVSPWVTERNNPIISVEPPLPIFGTHYGLNYCFQFTQFQVDFFPGNSIALPSELPALANQQFALHGQVCAGLGCPPDRTLSDMVAMADSMASAGYLQAANQTMLTSVETADRQTLMRLAPATRDQQMTLSGGRVVAQPQVGERIIPLPTRQLLCFCLDLYAVGHVDMLGPANAPYLQPAVDGLDIQDIKPDNMEDSLLCYVNLLLKLSILPKARLVVPHLVIGLLGFAGVSPLPTPISAAVPHNPAVEDDQAKVFVNLKFGPPPPPTPPGPPSPPAPSRTINWSPNGPAEPPGPDHLTVAASSKAVSNLFGAVRDGFAVSKSDSGSFGPFSAGYSVGLKLDDGNVELRNDGSIAVKELKPVLDPFDFWLGIDLPKICVGGFCIIPNPFDGCVVRAPKICVFGGNPDFTIDLDLSHIYTAQLSMAAFLSTKYGIEATRPAGLSDLDAEDMKIPNLWGIFLTPEWVNIELFDFADTVANLLEKAITDAIKNLLPGPQWAKDAILAILGPIIDLIRFILNIPFKITDWLSDLIGHSLGLFNWIAQIIIEHFTSKSPLVKLEDPFPVPGTNAQPGLNTIKIPVRDVAVHVNAAEIALTAKVGAIA